MPHLNWILNVFFLVIEWVQASGFSGFMLTALFLSKRNSLITYVICFLNKFFPGSKESQYNFSSGNCLIITMLFYSSPLGTCKISALIKSYYLLITYCMCFILKDWRYTLNTHQHSNLHYGFSLEVLFN